MKDDKTNRRLITKGMKQRMVALVTAMACCFLALIVVLGIISLVNHDRYSALAISQQLRDTVITANRGSIYDRNMNELARSATVWTVAISPMDLEESDRETVAKGLSEILELDYEDVLAKCGEKNYYSIVKRKVDQPVVDEIRQYLVDNEVGGVTFTEDSKRYYPYGNFLAQVLGFVGTDNYGLSGIEAYYDSVLAGTEGRVITAKNAVGSDMYYEYETRYDAEQGNSLVLTVDEVIQHYLESALETAVKEHNVENRACGIVMNVNTGEIYAMATKNDFDPNSPFTITDEKTLASLAAITDEEQYKEAYSQAQQMQWNNKCVSEIYEPGSVFKAITAATALEVGSSTIDSTYVCNGSYSVVPSVSMSCANGRVHGTESFVDCIVNSCNCAFIQIGQGIGATSFYDYLRSFGMTEKTGVDLPGEALSNVIRGEDMTVVNLASCSFGQSNAFTPMQMITSFSAVVNGGYLVTPYIVKEVIDADGNIVESRNAEVKRQVVSNETSREMCLALEQMVLSASGRNAYVAGYRIGGKSGTSQKLGGEQGDYVASFCAFAPANDPEVIVLILLDEAHSATSIYGSTLVGPLVGQVMSNVLPYLGIDAVYTDEELETVDISTPMVVGDTLTNAYAALQRVGLSYVIEGEGTSVLSQFPLAGQAVPRGSEVVLYTDEEGEKTVSVPDLTGRTAESATSLLRAVGLNIRLSGSKSSGAVAVSQSLEAGSQAAAGTVVDVEFLDNSLID